VPYAGYFYAERAVTVATGPNMDRKPPAEIYGDRSQDWTVTVGPGVATEKFTVTEKAEHVKAMRHMIPDIRTLMKETWNMRYKMDVGNQDKTKFPSLPETAFYRQITRTKIDSPEEAKKKLVVKEKFQRAVNKAINARHFVMLARMDAAPMHFDDDPVEEPEDTAFME
jgi:hypothetical protein